MTDAEKRVHFADIRLAEYRANQAVEAEMKAHLKTYKEELTNLRALLDKALWVDGYTEGDIDSIRHAIAQIEVGPDADPAAIRSSYIEAMGTTSRLLSEAEAAAQAQIATLQRGLADQLEALGAVKANANASPQVDDAPVVEQVMAEMSSSYWQHYDAYKAHKALGQEEEAAAALKIFLPLFAAAHPDAQFSV